MKTLRFGPVPARLDADPHPMRLAEYIAGYLSSKAEGGVFAEWDDAKGAGLWFYSKDGKAIFRSPEVDEVLFREDSRSRFRSVVFRLGSAASDVAGGLCGVVRLVPDGADPAGEPARRCFVHASFEPEAGLWFRATIVTGGVAAAGS
jgi:hypothetical protein